MKIKCTSSLHIVFSQFNTTVNIGVTMSLCVCVFSYHLPSALQLTKAILRANLSVKRLSSIFVSFEYITHVAS